MTAMAKTVDIQVGLVSGIAVQKSLFLFSFSFLFWYIFNNLCQPGANIVTVPRKGHASCIMHVIVMHSITGKLGLACDVPKRSFPSRRSPQWPVTRLLLEATLISIHLKGDFHHATVRRHQKGTSREIWSSVLTYLCPHIWSSANI